MSDKKPKPHPSGRPYGRVKTGTMTRPRPPRDEPLTPRLQKRGTTEAIGFYVPRDDYDDED